MYALREVKGLNNGGRETLDMDAEVNVGVRAAKAAASGRRKAGKRAVRLGQESRKKPLRSDRLSLASGAGSGLMNIRHQ